MQTERESHGRIIFHVDANSFFASCEIARDPSLQKKPVVVAGDPKERKGIVLAASYVAKQQFGIYTTMPLWEAKKTLSIARRAAAGFRVIPRSKPSLVSMLTAFLARIGARLH